MIAGAARDHDSTHGICYHSSHNPPLETDGYIIASGSTVTINNQIMARVGDAVLANCGHISYIIGSSGTVGSENKQMARIGDSVGNGPYIAIITSGSTDCQIG